MAVVFRELIKGYKKLIYDIADQRTVEWPLVGSPVPLLVILAIYLWFVKKIGPDYMKNRAPYSLDAIIQVYNVAQVLMCAYLTVAGIGVYYPFGEYSIICQSISFEDTPFNFNVLRLTYYYTLVKLLDLMDTVFFVLRKKQSQVSFLHVYHHVLMVIVCWIGMRYVPGGQSAFIGVINSFVHTVMYMYYFLTNYNKNYRKNVWWKKHLTQLQIFQFGSLFVHSSMVFFYPDCIFPHIVMYILLPQNLFIFLLFWDFYKKNY